MSLAGFKKLKSEFLDTKGLLRKDKVKSDFLVAYAFLRRDMSNFGERFAEALNSEFLSRTLTAIVKMRFVGLNRKGNRKPFEKA